MGLHHPELRTAATVCLETLGHLVSSCACPSLSHIGFQCSVSNTLCLHSPQSVGQGLQAGEGAPSSGVGVNSQVQESPGAASATLYRILVYLLGFKTGGLSRNLENLHSVDVYSRCDNLKKSRTPRPSK